MTCQRRGLVNWTGEEESEKEWDLDQERRKLFGTLMKKSRVTYEGANARLDMIGRLTRQTTDKGLQKGKTGHGSQYVRLGRVLLHSSRKQLNRKANYICLELLRGFGLESLFLVDSKFLTESKVEVHHHDLFF